VTPDEIRRAFAKVEMRLTDIETAARRDRDDQKREFAAMVAGARKNIEETIARSEPLSQMQKLVSLNEEQMAILNEAREERIRRAERDRLAAEAKEKDAAAKAEEEKEEAKQAARRRDALERQLKLGALLVTFITALGGAFGACHLTRNLGGPTNGSPTAH
jgi:hypothetical protein